MFRSIGLIQTQPEAVEPTKSIKLAESKFGLKIEHAPPPRTTGPTNGSIRDALEEDIQSNVVVDVVFVHGLGGDRDTWSHSTKKDAFWPLWLKDHEGCENVRIITYTYDASWMNLTRPQNILGIKDFGEQLASRLKLHYREKGDVLRIPVQTPLMQ